MAAERRLTYRALMAEIDAVAAGLAARGIGQGTRVATVLPSTFDHCIALLALGRLGAVPARINFRLGPDAPPRREMATGGVPGPAVVAATRARLSAVFTADPKGA